DALNNPGAASDSAVAAETVVGEFAGDETLSLSQRRVIDDIYMRHIESLYKNKKYLDSLATSCMLMELREPWLQRDDADPMLRYNLFMMRMRMAEMYENILAFDGAEECYQIANDLATEQDMLFEVRPEFKASFEANLDFAKKMLRYY